MKKVVIAIGVIIGLVAVGYLGNIVLMVVGGSVGRDIIEAVPDKHQFFTADQETFLTQFEGTWVAETDTTKTNPMTIKISKEDLTITQVAHNNLVYPAKHVKITDTVLTLYNLGQKPNMAIELITPTTLSVPNLNATNDTQPTDALVWTLSN